MLGDPLLSIVIVRVVDLCRLLWNETTDRLTSAIPILSTDASDIKDPPKPSNDDGDDDDGDDDDDDYDDEDDDEWTASPKPAISSLNLKALKSTQ